MMNKVICILNCVLLVASNPLQGLQSCPQVQYLQNYGQPDGPILTPSNYKPYQQQVVVQNPVIPSVQTIPYLNNDQISRLYYKVQPSPTVNSIADANTRVYDHNGVEIARYITNPAGASPNVVNNYIIVPPEYFKLNQSVPNEKYYYPCQMSDVENKEYKETENHKKTKKNKDARDKHTYVNNYDKTTSDKHSEHTSKKKNKSKNNKKMNKSKRKSSKKNKNECDAQDSPKIKDEDGIVLKPVKQKSRSKSKTLEKENDKKVEEYKDNKPIVETAKIDEIFKMENQKNEKNKKHKSDQENSMDSQTKNGRHNDIHSDNKPNENVKKTADVDVCFDINEECANLESRKTRNNCCDRNYSNNYNNRRCNNHNQQNTQRDCSANIASYLNSIMSMPHLNTNFYNPMGNFPYNFNYMYQMPQQNTRSNNSNKRRKKGKKKQKTNNSNTEGKPNKNEDPEETSSGCEKVVELTPQFVELEEINEPLILELTSSDTENEISDSETKKSDNDKTVTEPPTPPEIITPPNTYVHSEETLYVAPVLAEDIPFLNDNDIVDEYYPDFTSDNIYLSREDYDFNNFHDRYYYASDNKAEMSREKRRYEQVNGKNMKKSKDIRNKKHENINNGNKKTNQQQTDNLKDKESNPEVQFRAPPALDFIDFKTEMVHKDRDNPKKENEVSKYTDYNHEVETVFAHSKVVKYGASPNTQGTSLFDFTQPNTGDEKILLTRDGDTTVVIARSLGYPEDY